MSAEVLQWDLCTAAQRIKEREISSEELTRQALQRARELQGRFNSFITLDEEALEAARKADLAVARGAPLGPLHGVPLAHKDMFYRKGKVSTGGSRLLEHRRATVTATVVTRLEAAGAIWMGGLNMSEFAANPTGQNESYGDCRNAWDEHRISGGSSSGSGVALALRLCFGSLGSDTGGSVRLPAALNGVVGLRPTYGRVSRYGMLPRTWSMDTAGPITRTARDCARLLGVIAGADPQDATASLREVPAYESCLTGDLSGLRIGIPVNYFYDRVSQAVRTAMEQSLAILKNCGAELIEVQVPDPASLYQIGNLISQVEAAAIHGNLVREFGDRYPLVLKTRMESGFYVPAVDYLNAQTSRSRLTTEFVEAVFSQVDVLHTPVLGMTAPRIEDMSPKRSAEVFPILAQMARNTRPISTLGLPALSVPAGFSGEGLPIAFQLVGRPFAEGLLLKVADAYQRLTNWHLDQPQPIPTDAGPDAALH